METEHFGVLILTHGRARKVLTYKTLRKQGYTGPIYLVVDNEDDQVEEYRAIYGEQVIVFDKAETAKRVDAMDLIPDRRTVVFARNEAFTIAEKLDLDWFLELDDDYTGFVYKHDAELSYRERPVKNLDRLFALLLQFYQGIPRALTVALAQCGDYIGGQDNLTTITLRRKAMNTFFCSPARPFSWVGRMNDDVNTYVSLGSRGGLFFTCFSVAIHQQQTQKRAGGLTEMYLDFGTYVKSFYTVMIAPSCVVVNEMGEKHRRIHHRIEWRSAVPCIVSEKYRKT